MNSLTSQPVYKTLDELGFSDLYVDTTDDNLPHLRHAVKRLFRFIHSRRFQQTTLTDDEESQEVSYPLVITVLTVPKLKT